MPTADETADSHPDFRILTQVIAIGIEFLEAKLGGSEWKGEIVFAERFVFHRPASTDLNAICENAKLRMAIGRLVGIGHDLSAALMLTILS